MTTVTAANAVARADAPAGDRAARLFASHSPSVLALCRALLRDPHEAEDAAQQAFLSACRALRAGVRPRDEPAWLAAIARNECRARICRRMSQPTCAPLEVAAHGSAPSAWDAFERRAASEELCRALLELPRREREAVTLRELRGLRYEEVAAAMGIRAASVEPLLWRARRRLRDHLRDARPADRGPTGRRLGV